MYIHLFFYHSSVDGHVDCFYVLAIANSAAMNTGVHISLELMVLGIFPSHVVVLFSFLSETSILFYTVAASIYILINSVQGFPYLLKTKQLRGCLQYFVSFPMFYSLTYLFIFGITMQFVGSYLPDQRLNSHL